MWFLAWICAAFSSSACQMRLRIADVFLLLGFAWCSVHQLAGFGFRLLMRFFAWICLTSSTPVGSIRLLIPDVILCMCLIDFQYISLLDSASDCCCVLLL